MQLIRFRRILLPPAQVLEVGRLALIYGYSTEVSDRGDLFKTRRKFNVVFIQRMIPVDLTVVDFNPAIVDALRSNPSVVRLLPF